MSSAEIRAPDRLFGGRLLLRQPERGHRVGTDAVLLAAAAPLTAHGLAIDLGAGVGAVGISAAQRNSGLDVLLIDNDAAALALAHENIALNGVADRVSTLLLDILSPPRKRSGGGLSPGSAALVLSNPPFGSPQTMRPSPDRARAAAHVMPAGGLDRWIAAAAAILAPGGVLVMIHRADALSETLAALGAAFGAIAVKPVHPRRDAPATRILVRAAKGARGPLALAPSLILHGDGDGFTPEAEAIHRGEAAIAF